MAGKALKHGEAFVEDLSVLGKAKHWLNQQVWTQKLDNPLGIALLLSLMLPLVYALSAMPLKTGLIVFIGLIGLPLVIFCLFDLTFSLGLMTFISLMVVFGAKFVSAPIGTVLDLLILISGVGILLRQIKERDWSFGANPIGYIVLIWLYYNFLQILNPLAESKMAWLFTIRSVAIQQLVFFIAAYAFKDSKENIYRILKLIMILCFACTLYGLKQEFVGFSDGEKIWVAADQLRYQLYFQWGRMRVMSFCWDPTTFGILAACFGTFCTVLVMGVQQYWKKGLLLLSAALSFLVMAYTGTRTAFVLVPLGLVFFAGLILNARVIAIMAIGLVLGVGFVIKSPSNAVAFRIQSAFKPGEDESMNLRLENQKLIQPYIQSHPMGGGLGSCGEWGKRFNPDSFLAKFPHDSSFVRMAVELGWIGLIIYTLFHFIVLRVGLYYYIRVRDPMIKAIYAGITTWIFMLAVACYAQEAILQLPTNIIYNIFLGVLVTLKNFDPNFQANSPLAVVSETTALGMSSDSITLDDAQTIDNQNGTDAL